ncbi:hypothetical protein EPN28_04590 [Patescibacteria group bacterium]|nr:MAG: hypothetical protein EPN28_04590 [Patescibacteria group bacterium]
MSPLRKYQLDIVFLFFAFMLIAWISFYIIQGLGLDPHDYEWYIAGPLLALFAGYLLELRAKINKSEQRSVCAKSLTYWIALGVALFATYAAPIPAKDFWSSNALFIAFTLLLADSYWDFRALTLKTMFRK